MVPDDSATRVVARRYMRQDPVMVTAFRQVHHVGKDFCSGLEGIPQQLEDAAGHVRMSDQIVWLTYHFRFGIAGDLEKGIVGVSDMTLQIGFTDDQIICI